MDFGTGWMADPTIFDTFRQLRDIYRDAPQPRPYQPQVAIITDEDSFFYLRHSNEITTQSVSLQRRLFNTCGCPVGLYLMSDLCEGRVPASVRLCVMLNAYRVTAEQRAQLRKQLARSGKTVVWLYAPGFIKESASAENVSDLIGFRVAELGPGLSSVVEVLPTAPPLAALAGHAFGPEAKPKPLFAVAPEQAGVLALGHYRGTDQVALAMKQADGWTSVFCGGLQVSAEVLRELARAAGAHVWCHSNDVISACPGFVSIHATADGDKELLMPAPSGLRDLVTGEKLPARASHRLAMKKGETRLFAITP